MTMDVAAYRKEFNDSLNFVAFYATKLTDPYDRINCAEWLRKLATAKDTDLNSVKIRNEYMQYLRTMMTTDFLSGPFKQAPPGGSLRPLAEVLCNSLADQIKELPRCGAIFPVVTQQTPDGLGSLHFKCTNQGLLCYMAITGNAECAVENDAEQ